jgi:hypothetical protein
VCGISELCLVPSIPMCSYDHDILQKKMDERMWKKPSECEEGSKILESLLYLQRSALRYDHVGHHPTILSDTYNEIK